MEADKVRIALNNIHAAAGTALVKEGTEREAAEIIEQELEALKSALNESAEADAPSGKEVVAD